MENKKKFHKYKKYAIINQRGFTLIELLVSLALFSIVAIMIFSLFNNYTKSSKRLNDEIELQAQGQKLITLISGKLMDCEGFSKLYDKDNEDVLIKFIDSSEISVFNIKNIDGNYESFVLNNKLLYYQYISDGDPTKNAEITESNIVSKYIDSITISSSEEGKSINNTAFINIKINFKKNFSDYTIEQNIHLRNLR